jgi:hypothetical protein
MDLEYTYMLMLGTVDILDDNCGTDTTATTNSTTTTTDADHAFMSFKIAATLFRKPHSIYSLCLHLDTITTLYSIEISKI